MQRNILDTYSTKLARRVDGATDPEKRAIALAACQLVVERELGDDVIVRRALGALEEGRYGDSQVMTGLHEHVVDLDKAYFAAQEECWSKHTSAAIYLDLFAKARAANAVLFAFGADATDAVLGAVYESCAALGEEIVEAQIDRVVPGTAGVLATGPRK